MKQNGLLNVSAGLFEGYLFNLLMYSAIFINSLKILNVIAQIKFFTGLFTPLLTRGSSLDYGDILSEFWYFTV